MKKIQWLVLSIWFMSAPSLAQESDLSVRTQGAQQAVAKVVYGHSMAELLVGSGIGHGTGFFVDQQTLVTNYHVIAPLLLFSSDASDFEDLLESSYIEKGEQRYAITDVKNVSIVDDLAILQVEGYQGPVLELAEKETQLGDTISIPGFPRIDKIPEYIQTIKLQEITGAVVGIAAYCNLTDLSLKIDFFSVLTGASGSPILNSSGKVVGVLHSTGGMSMACGATIKYLRYLLQNRRSQNISAYDFMKSKIVETLDQAIEGEDIVTQYRLAALLLQTTDMIPEYIVTNHPLVDNGIHPKMLALNFMKDLAEKGHVTAQLNLGILYKDGLSIERAKWFSSEKDSLLERDIEQSLYWAKQAADQGLPSAQYLVSQLYRGSFILSGSSFMSMFFSVDTEKGQAYLEQAAGQGYILAEFELYYSMSSCSDMEKSKSAKVNLIDEKQEDNACKQNRRAVLEEFAERGYPEAQYRLGRWYRNRGDIYTAIEWYERAADQGYQMAQLNLGEIYYYGYNRSDMLDDISREYNESNEFVDNDKVIIESDEEQAFYWLHRAIVQNQIIVSEPELTRMAFKSTEEDTVFINAMKSISRGATYVKEWFKDEDSGITGVVNSEDSVSNDEEFGIKNYEEGIDFEAEEE